MQRLALALAVANGGLVFLVPNAADAAELFGRIEFECGDIDEEATWCVDLTTSEGEVLQRASGPGGVYRFRDLEPGRALTVRIRDAACECSLSIVEIELDIGINRFDPAIACDDEATCPDPCEGGSCGGNGKEDWNGGTDSPDEHRSAPATQATGCSVHSPGALLGWSGWLLPLVVCRRRRRRPRSGPARR